MIDQNKHDGFTTEVSADWENIPKIYHNVMNGLGMSLTEPKISPCLVVTHPIVI